MATVKIEWHWFHAGSRQLQTVDVNIPPSWIGAHVSLYGVSGEGLHQAGIKYYRRRLDSGADEDHDFGDWPWPPVIFDFITSITFAATTGEDQEAYAVARMDYWV